ncbi:MAG TPA: histidine phosphatase family protein [Albitalea sp.]
MASSLALGAASALIPWPALAGTPQRGADPAGAKVRTVEALRKGGFVLVMRHASTEFGEVDAYPLQFDNPSAQRTLSDLGRLESRGLGKAMKTAGVPVARVYASQLRRAIETAQCLGFDEMVSLIELTDDAWESAREMERRAAALRALAASAPPKGANVLIVAQKPIITRALGEQLASIRHAEMVVVQPVASGIRIADRLTKEQWRSTLGAMNIRLTPV